MALGPAPGIRANWLFQLEWVVIAHVRPGPPPAIPGAMKTPAGLQPLIDDGVIDEVIRSLKSGKEATVYMVRSGSQIRCAKVYRDMGQRSFQKRATYQEGRKVRGSRQARAMNKSTRFAARSREAAWKNAEVDALYQLVAADVRVAEAVRLLQRCTHHGAGDRRRRQPGPPPGRSGPATGHCARISPVSHSTDRAHVEHRPHPRRSLGIQRPRPAPTAP